MMEALEVPMKNKYTVTITLNQEQINVIKNSLSNVNISFDREEILKDLLDTFTCLDKKLNKTNILECEVNNGKETFKVIV